MNRTPYTLWGDLIILNDVFYRFKRRLIFHLFLSPGLPFSSPRIPRLAFTVRLRPSKNSHHSVDFKFPVKTRFFARLFLAKASSSYQFSIHSFMLVYTPSVAYILFLSVYAFSSLTLASTTRLVCGGGGKGWPAKPRTGRRIGALRRMVVFAVCSVVK